MMRAPRYAAMLVAMAALLWPALARAQAVPAGLDSATAAAIAPIVEQAKATGLPVGALYVKAREGQVRRVPLAAITSAVRALVQRLRSANDALAPNPSEQELRAAADAIKQGVGAETLRAMRKAGGDGSLAVPLGVLTQLILRGVPVEKASMKVVDLLNRGAMPQTFIALDESVRQDVLAGRHPDESLDLRLKGIIPNLPQSQTNADAAGLQANTPKRPR
jgi:hypothetical protein